MISSSSSSIKNNPVASKGAAKSPLHFLYLVALCAIIVYSYDSLLDPYNGDGTTTGRRQMGTGSGKQPGKRAMAVVKSVWPECVENHLTAIQCKDFIDTEIMTLFSEEDRFIRTKIVGKRDEGDEWYNAIVIQMDDNDLTLGRNSDGKVYYDFEWDGSGEQATIEQETEIPPVIATETTSGAIEGSQVVTEYAEYTPDGNDLLSGTATDPTEAGGTTSSPPGGWPETTPQAQIEEPQTTDAPLQVQVTTAAPLDGSLITTTPAPFGYIEPPLVPEEQPILVEGGTVDGTIAGTETNPINGGVILDGSASNTEEGEATLNDALNTEPVIPEAGARQIPAFDCAGLTGFSCCLMIKHTIRDHDTNNKAIQCYLEYSEGTGKRNYMDLEGGKKVIIHSNHNGYVSKEPKIVGNWDGESAGTGTTDGESAVTTVAPTTTQAEAGSTPQRDIDWLESHNTRRQLWHENNGATYVPMQWSNALEAEALVFAHHLADTSQFYHDSDRGPYGENLAMNSGSGEPSTTDYVLSRWVEGEANDPYPANGHLTQVLWRASTWVGCADASNGNTHVQVCRYARPGNCNMNNYATWLEPMLLPTSLCGAECHPSECSVSNVEETPVVPQTTAVATVVSTTTQSATQAASGDRNADWVASHNARRQTWHEDNSVSYVPLQWSAALAAESLVFAQHLADTNQFYHDPNRGSYGENLAMNSGYGGQRTTENVVGRWVEGEIDEVYPANGHLTQVLWRPTTWVGCADAQSGDRHIQVCRYAVPGNCNMGNYDTWLEPMLLDTSPCGAACHPDEC